MPCGGRPEAINVNNVSQLWDTEGKPNFKYIVEGANLFITQQARLALEKRGVVLFKDASANKVRACPANLLVVEGGTETLTHRAVSRRRRSKSSPACRSTTSPSSSS